MKFRFKILLYILPIIAIFALGIVVIPPRIHLNFLKPKIENIILTKTGIPIKIHGDINISLLGSATIVAHNITFPNGVISSCEFAIPFFDIFDLKNAQISDRIIINKASIVAKRIVPFDVDIPIIVKDSKIQFLNKEYQIINASLSKDKISATVRTDQHKYEIITQNNSFIIKNRNNKLTLIGELFPDGTATADINIVAQDVNKWFEFEKPRITGQFPITAKLTWNGRYGVNFYDISANGVYGSAKLDDEGYKIVELKSSDANYDMSFFATNPDVLQDTELNLDFYGNLKFLNHKFNHIHLNTSGAEDKIEINSIIADDWNFVGGTIDEAGAHDVFVSIPHNGVETTCLFNGTPTNWACTKFSYADTISGTLSVDKDKFVIDLISNQNITDIKTLVNTTKELGKSGVIKFESPDTTGKITINKDDFSVEYSRIDNKSLLGANIDLGFLPGFMKSEKGNFIWNGNKMMFFPESKTWQLSMIGNEFIIRGDNFKEWFPSTDLQSLRNLDYVISGNYKNGAVSNLTIEIAEHKFTGSLTKKSITLKTDLLNMDYFINPEFKENYEELSFFVAHPLTIPFDSDINIALSADTIIYENQRYKNFVYSLHKNNQTFSITDSNRGNLLANIAKDNIKYTINIQLNKFVAEKKLLPANMPLNISDTTLTAEIKLKTYGKIASDIFDNLSGTFDASFDGGTLYGFDFDKFYASAPVITTLNGERILNAALIGGTSKIKKMHIVGTYEHGDIKTTKPLTLSMRHVDATGKFEIVDNKMSADLNLSLRGISPDVEPISISIKPNNYREFSLSEVMLNFDAEYMKAFVQSHNQF